MPEYQAHLFTGRWRKIAAPEPSEFQLQMALVEYCRWRLRPDVEMWATPNGELRDKRTAAKLKASGVLPGVADLTFEWGPPPQTLHLELKARGRKPTPEQVAFGERCWARGHFWAWADNLDSALQILDGYQLFK